MKRLLCKALLLSASVLSFKGYAEDIDLFVGNSNPDAPNVLFVIDNTANWNQAFDNLKAALVNTLDSMPEDRFRVGIMLYNETGSPNNNIAGGYVRAAIREMNAATKPRYMALVNDLDKLGDKGNGAIASLVMAEVYRYLSGGAAYAGNNKVKADYLGNAYGGAGSPSAAVWSLDSTLYGPNALGSFGASQYNDVTLNGCQKNFIIYLSNGPSADNSSSLTVARNMLVAAGGDATEIPVSPSGLQENLADEWVRHLRESDLGAITYTIDINPGTTGKGPAWTAILKSMANVGDGKYFAVDSEDGGGAQISDALLQILSEIQSVNSVFASVSLPVSVNTQGTYLNQVFIGMFRPDGLAKPRWAGNLKQYKLGYVDGSSLKLIDADNRAAISSIDSGFIAECARSFWTPTALDSYWQNYENDDANCIGYPAQSNTPDGNVVEKGGQGYTTRSLTPWDSRRVLTCNSGCSSLINFTPSTPGAVTPAAMGDAGMTSDEFTRLVNWARGLNNGSWLATLDADGNPVYVNPDERIVSSTNVRPSVHGDIVHSRPVAINFGTATDEDVVVFYGGNDGMLRAVDGDQYDASGGSEFWAFFAPEFAPHIRRLRRNSPLISFEGIEDGQPKPYGVDGPVTAYKNGSETIVFATLRRGGRSLYAFDVSDYNAPTLLWRKACAGTTCNDSDFDNLGQTWSGVKGITAKGYRDISDSPIPLGVFGGGYDPCEDSDPHSCTSDSKGNSVYVVNARTGDRIREFDTERGVVADVTVVPDADGFASYIYTADLAGNVYRISGVDAITGAIAPIGMTDPADWVMTKIADLGGSGSDARKFMFAPDVVIDGGGYIIVLGSGDREKPLNTYTASNNVQNRFYAIKDVPANPTWLVDACSSGVDYICNSSLLPITSDATPDATEFQSYPKGWYLDLADTEQVVTAAITVFGVITFSTHQPTPEDDSLCSSLGIANVYNINLKDAAPANGTQRYQRIDGDGLPPSPVAGAVTLEDGSTVPFCIGCSGDSPLEGGEPPPPPLIKQPKAKVYWNIERGK